MVNSKTILSQFQRLQIIIQEILSKGMTIDETFQMASIIEKLPTTWKDFKNYLKHKTKEMSLENLIKRLCIEEDNHRANKKGSSQVEMKTNIVETYMLKKKKTNKVSGSRLGPNGGI